ncbi:MAG: SufD family Fe-S cluster assembly protein [Bradyrhizobium sp.]|nr:MAG: SufD family Fe-S cluster assembly protein [Bradyrhizobium sp.]
MAIAITPTPTRPRERAMTAQRAPASNAAELVLAEQFRALPREVASPARAAAFRRFEEAGLPNRRVEAWHYTDLRAALAAPAATLGAPDAAAIAEARKRLAVLERLAATRLVLLDGYFIAALSDPPPAGVALAPTPPLAPPASDPVLALNVALAQGGLAATFATQTAAKAIEIVHLVSAEGAGAIYSRVALTLEANAQASVVERFVGAGAATQRQVSTWFDLAPGAQATHVALIEDAPALHVESQVVRLAERAAFDGFGLVAGGALARRQIFATLEGVRGRVGFSGLGLVDGLRQADTTLEVVHAAPHGQSREFFRHIVADEGTGVFQGKVIVKPGAQKTDGGMKSQAILLSPHATMDAKPELEIFADDVVCGHGATVGALDAQQLFYLRSRGLPEAEAEAMLLEAFAAEAIGRVADPALAEALLSATRVWLAARGQGRRM